MQASNEYCNGSERPSQRVSSHKISKFICLIDKPHDQELLIRVVRCNRPFFPKSFALPCSVGSSLQHLQNKLKELFLLNFICPDIFVDYAGLDSFLPTTLLNSNRISWDKPERRKFRLFFPRSLFFQATRASVTKRQHEEVLDDHQAVCRLRLHGGVRYEFAGEGS